MKRPMSAIPAEEKDSTAKATTPTPAEIENKRLRAELVEERTKTEALSRRCIRLGEALDAAILAEENRTEKSMFDHINGNCYHREALLVSAKRREVQERRMAEAFENACTKNALSLCASFVVCLVAIILGFVGFIHTAIAAILAGCALMAFGWALNDCFYLLGRCGK